MRYSLSLRSSLALIVLTLVAAGAMAAGDADAGAAKSAVCAACHGANGNSNGVSNSPSIAGQHETYLLAQLRAIQRGDRQVVLMVGQLDNLTDQDLQDLASYYASQQIHTGAASEQDLDLGERIFRGGVAEKGVAACTACHSPHGYGNAPAAYPRLAGQIPNFVISALQAYRDGEREGVLTGPMMPQIAANLNDREIRALANYIYGLH